MKDVILNNYSQEYIFSIYLRISEVEIFWCLERKNRKICNNHRLDVNPSLGFVKYNDKIIARDYADNRYRGDIFEVVGYIIGENSKSGEGLNKICLHILDTIGDSNTIDLMRSYKEEVKYITEVKDITIELFNRKANNYDYEYWNKYGIIQDIVDNNIIMVSKYMIDNKVSKYTYKIHDPCYAYVINDFYYKLYFPTRKNTGLPRFITNSKNVIENIDFIKYKQIQILSKSQKDTLLMQRIIKELNLDNIGVITLSTEIDYLSNRLVNFIGSKSDIVYVAFDYDMQGISSSNKLRDKYGYIPVFFGNSYQTKDISDYCKQSNYNKTVNKFKDVIVSENSDTEYKVALR